MCVHFSHHIPDKTKLADDTVSDEDFFPSSVQALSIIEILIYKNIYIANRNLWVNRLYYEISNFRQKQCLKIDTSDVNKLGPAKFRTQADSGTEQVCYYNTKKKKLL